MAKDVITRFKLESTQYDSKIKNAAKELSDVAKAAKSAGADFERFTKDNMEAARSLGNIATSSTNAKDRAKELVGAFNDVARSYNQLTKEQQQSDFGKAMAQSLTQLQQRIRETKEEMKGLESGGGLFGGGKLDGMLQVFGGNVMTKVAGMATGLVTEMGDAVKQGIELARQGEGIRIAFERLGRGDILDGLREATHGTVTDLELMKAAVKFNDFRLPVEELGTMLAFAQQKAKDTGQSVDYMVDSIVTGLGRKSLMILDNLGLSASEIKERMKETGDMTKAVGAIIRDQMAAAGDYVETAADRAAQANVSLQNKMEELGRKFAPVEEASNQLWTSMKIGILDIVGGPLARLLNDLTEAGRLKNALRDINGDGSNGAETRSGKALRILREYSGGGRGIEGKRELYDRQVASFQNQEEKEWRKANRLRDELAGLRRKQREDGTAGNLQPLIDDTTRQLEAAENRAKAFQIAKNEYVKGAKDILKPVNVNVNTKQAEQNVASLRKQLKELEEQRKKAVKSGDQEQVEALTKQISQTKTNLGYLDPSATKGTKAVQDDFTEITGLIGMAEERVSDLQRRIKEAPDETTITILRDQLKEAQAELDRLNGKEVKIQMETGTSIQNNAGMSAYIASIKQQLETADYGTSLYNGLSAQLSDMTTLQNLVGESLKSGLGTAMFDAADATGKDFWTRAMEGGVDNTDWQGIVDKINEKLKELGIDPIKINFETGNIANVGKETEKSWRGAAGAMSAAGSALQGLEDPGAKIAGIVGQAIANIALGFSQATAASSGGGVFGWIAAIAGGLTTMLSTISAIHSATGYAQGGIVDGRGGGFVGGMAYSGDNIGNVRLDSGELVLNRSQQNNLANALEGGNNTTVDNRQPYVNGELIFLGLNNYLKRTGRGEIVVSKR